MRPPSEASGPGYPLQVRPRSRPSRFGLSVTIPGRANQEVSLCKREKPAFYHANAHLYPLGWITSDNFFIGL